MLDLCGGDIQAADAESGHAVDAPGLSRLQWTEIRPVVCQIIPGMIHAVDRLACTGISIAGAGDEMVSPAIAAGVDQEDHRPTGFDFGHILAPE